MYCLFERLTIIYDISNIGSLLENIQFPDGGGGTLVYSTEIPEGWGVTHRHPKMEFPEG